LPEINAIAAQTCSLGYNLERLSDLTSLGREPFWDPWKGLVAAWDRDELDRPARGLRLSTNDHLEPE
jgi:hypothetical protein